MFTVFILYLSVISLSAIACLSLEKNGNRDPLCSLHKIIFTFLVVFAVFRSDRLPDYAEYMNYFRYYGEDPNVEKSFYVIRSIVKFLKPINGELLLLLIYAMLGIGIKYYAIKRYSPYVVFSLCVWLSSFYILHDLIQMRASVASGLLLLLIPELQKKNIVKSIIIIIIAFFFHNSAIVFILLFFMNAKTVKWKFWTGIYICCLLINVLNIDFSDYINSIFGLVPTDIIGGRLSAYTAREYIQNNERTSMFAPYILLQTFICFGLLFSINKLKSVSPYVILWLKTCFLSICIYSLSIPGVSMRLAELLSIPYIFLIPLCIDAFPLKYKYVGAEFVVVTICLLLLSNFIFVKDFIPL